MHTFSHARTQLVLVLEYLLQRHYLREYSASLAENFYGLKRVPIASLGHVSGGDDDNGANSAVDVDVAWGNAAGDSDASAAAEGAAGPARLSARHRALSLLFLVVGPYLARKAAAWRDSAARSERSSTSLTAVDRAALQEGASAADVEGSTHMHDRMAAFRRFLLRSYPYAVAAWNASAVAMHVLCLTGWIK
jgi:hypothetical protein